MIDTAQLTPELARRVTVLEADLRGRAEAVPEVAGVVEDEWRRAQAAGRTAHDLVTWREGLLTQVAVGWVLGTTFLRFCEDNGLVTDPVITGPGEGARRAEDAQRAWYRTHPADGERGYLTGVFRAAAELPGLAHVLGPHNPLWLFGPSDDAARELLAYWRDVVPETGALRRDFTDPSRSTRFLGDLYQHLSESARKQYALLQTPDFVEAFILDRTLEPALDEFGLQGQDGRGFRMIDPACGSGHFLLGAFDRLLARWRERDPQAGGRALAERALAGVFGVDLNPFAAAIARFRLLVAALAADGLRTLAEAPNFTINVAVGDALLHGPPPGQQVLAGVEEADPAARHLFATEDAETIHRFLGQRYHAVVANPPYITPKDPAANATYRRRYHRTCVGQFHLSTPFLERLFDLAIEGTVADSAGYVGVITDNAFMKANSGSRLVAFLSSLIDLTHLLDTSGASIPGHGTPTAVLFGRHRDPIASVVRCALSISGEPSGAGSRPAGGEVWKSMVTLIDRPGSRNDYIEVLDIPRSNFTEHPWVLTGGGARELIALLHSRCPKLLADASQELGYTGQTNADDILVSDAGSLTRRGIEERFIRTLTVGECFRDWMFRPSTAVVFPYLASGLADIDAYPGLMQSLWPYRTPMGGRRTFAKRTYFEEGRPWWGWHQVAIARSEFDCAIGFAFVATGNHYAVVREPLVYNRTAPFIRLDPNSVAEREYDQICGLLNSSVAAFWLKQVCFNKGSTIDARGARQTSAPFENFYNFDLGKVGLFPITWDDVTMWSTPLSLLARECVTNLPSSTLVKSTNTDSRETLNAARLRLETLRADMVSTQEELDWRCLHLYGVTSDDLSLPPGDAPPLARGERAFEIVLARRMAAGEVRTSWFARHGSTPVTDLPAHWPEPYRQLVERRIELIESDRFVGLVERPECKRRWNWDDWDDLEREALESWLLDRLESPRYWPDTMPRSVAQLADAARHDADLVAVAELCAGRVDVDLVELLGGLIRDESVPYLAAWRYTESGLRTRAAWERTWDLQRREDAGEAVGTIPVPPKYKSADFADKTYWKLRGKLDVPKERFVSYPGLGRDGDPTLLVGWAGWDHAQRARALAAVYEQRRSVDGWDTERLKPALAGLAELVPWLRQWHDDVDPATGVRLGEFFAGFVAAQAAWLGLAASELADRKPLGRTRGRRRKARA